MARDRHRGRRRRRERLAQRGGDAGAGGTVDGPDQAGLDRGIRTPAATRGRSIERRRYGETTQPSPPAFGASQGPSSRLRAGSRWQRRGGRDRAARAGFGGGTPMKWATRAGCKIDRAACAWLVRRFIDTDAAFVFVRDRSEVPPDAIPFEIPGAQLAHHDGACTFEVMLRQYELTDPALWTIARIVHEAESATSGIRRPRLQASPLSSWVLPRRATTSTPWRLRRQSSTDCSGSTRARPDDDLSGHAGRVTRRRGAAQTDSAPFRDGRTCDYGNVIDVP